MPICDERPRYRFKALSQLPSLRLASDRALLFAPSRFVTPRTKRTPRRQLEARPDWYLDATWGNDKGTSTQAFPRPVLVLAEVVTAVFDFFHACRLQHGASALAYESLGDSRFFGNFLALWSLSARAG